MACERSSALLKDARFCTAVVGVDPDMQNDDLALTFDTMLWRVAVDLGFEVEDRSQTPALTYLIGNGCRSEPMDCKRKLWKDAQTYVRARLCAAPRNPGLSEEDANRHMDYLWEFLKTQALATVRGTTPARYGSCTNSSLRRSWARSCVKLLVSSTCACRTHWRLPARGDATVATRPRGRSWTRRAVRAASCATAPATPTAGRLTAAPRASRRTGRRTASSARPTQASPRLGRRRARRGNHESRGCRWRDRGIEASSAPFRLLFDLCTMAAPAAALGCG